MSIGGGKSYCCGADIVDAAIIGEVDWDNCNNRWIQRFRPHCSHCGHECMPRPESVNCRCALEVPKEWIN